MARCENGNFMNRFQDNLTHQHVFNPILDNTKDHPQYYYTSAKIFVQSIFLGINFD